MNLHDRIPLGRHRDVFNTIKFYLRGTSYPHVLVHGPVDDEGRLPEYAFNVMPVDAARQDFRTACGYRIPNNYSGHNITGRIWSIRCEACNQWMRDHPGLNLTPIDHRSYYSPAQYQERFG